MTGRFAGFECGNDMELPSIKNGKWMDIAFQIQKEALGGQDVYLHVLVKKCAMLFNFGQRAESYRPSSLAFPSSAPSSERAGLGHSGPKTKADCEILTTWAIKHTACNPAKKFNIMPVPPWIHAGAGPVPAPGHPDPAGHPVPQPNHRPQETQL